MRFSAPAVSQSPLRAGYLYAVGLVLAVVAFLLLLAVGAVPIPLREVFYSLSGGDVSLPYIRAIVVETRLPMAVAALCCGALLSVAGLMMQTVFQNPLAGPSVLGISSGASFGVAVFMLGFGALFSFIPAGLQSFLTIICAMAGALAIMAVLFVFSSFLKTASALLIVGLMISYLCSSGISLLNYFSPAEEIRNYLVWGLGSFTGLRFNQSLWLLGFSVLSLVPSFLFIKPLNALLLGERYLGSMGYNARNVRGWILLLTGVQVAVATSFCGPIDFLGMTVPHICRLLFKTSNHIKLIPASIIFGALTGLLCALLGVIPSAKFGILPINVITPVIGVPVILYLLIRRNKLPYFS